MYIFEKVFTKRIQILYIVYNISKAFVQKAMQNFFAKNVEYASFFLKLWHGLTIDEKKNFYKHKVRVLKGSDWQCMSIELRL